MKRNGFTLVEILAVFSIIAFLGIIAIPSFQVVYSHVTEEMLKSKMSYIQSAAESWASETGLLITNVDYLIQEGKLEADDETGIYENPVDHSSLNCRVVRLHYENNQYSAEVTEEEVCDYDALLLENSKISLHRYDSSHQLMVDDGWTNDAVTLEIALQPDYDYPEDVVEIRWSGADLEKVVSVDHDFDEKKTLELRANQILNTFVEAQVTFLHEEKLVTYQARTLVQIDKQNPLIYDEDILVYQADEWTKDGKKVAFTMGDVNGSGIDAYALLQDSNYCLGEDVAYIKTMQPSVVQTLPAGKYFICARDQAGNFSQEYSTSSFVVDQVDLISPQVTVESTPLLDGESSVAFSIVDQESGIVSYAFGDENGPMEWMYIPRTSSYTFTSSYSEAGTYYLYVRDFVGNEQIQSFSIS